MNFFQSINYCLKHYSDFNGRASRSEFWWFFLFTYIVENIGMTLDYGFLSYFDTAQEFGIFETIAIIVFLLPTLAVGARRLHDINRSGWWQLLFLFMFVGIELDDVFSTYLDAGQEWGTFETISYLTFIPLIVWWCTKGTKKNNSHGKPIKLKK